MIRNEFTLQSYTMHILEGFDLIRLYMPSLILRKHMSAIH